MSHRALNLASKSFEQIIAIAIVIASCLVTISAAPQDQSESSGIPLVLGKGLERSISQSETHSYTLTLNVGQYAHVLVDQRGIDLIVTLYTPEGTKIVEVDSPNYTHGLEPISLVATSSGTYRLGVKAGSKRKTTSRYEVKLEALRIATAQEKNRIAAQQLSVDAKVLRNERTSDSYQKAIVKYQEAIGIWRALDDPLREAFALHEVGMIYGDIGQYQKALDAYANASTLYLGLGIRRGEASVLNNMGWIFGELGDNQKSLETYDRVAEAYEQIGDVDIVLISSMGSSYAKLGQYQRALEIHLRVMEVRRAAGDQAGLALTFNNIGNCYDHLGDKARALEFYNQALPLMFKAGEDFYTATTLNHLGVLYRNRGEFEKALSYFNDALARRKNVSDWRNVAVTLADISRLERSRGNLNEARKRIEEAIAIAEGLRSKVASQRLRASYFASVQQFREVYIDLLMRLHKEDPAAGFDRAAFAASEQGRARSLLELLKEAGTEIRHGVDPSLLERERALGQSIAEKAQKQMGLLSKPHTPEQAATAAKEITALTSDYEQVQAQIRQASPQYAALVQPVPLGLRETQTQVLDADTLLLEYSLGEEKSYVWAVTPDSIKSFELAKRSVIESQARAVYELLTSRNQSIVNETLEQRGNRLARSDAEYAKAAATLSQTLLGPVASELKNKRLLIVSDGLLQYVPFSALPDPVSATPLIVAHEIVTAPSVSVVALLRRETGNRKPAAKTLAVLADPVFSKEDPRLASARRAHAPRSSDDLNLGTLRRLRFSRQEAEEIIRLASDEQKLQALDFAANRALATSSELAEYRIVHFATHGLINNQVPELSGIVLSLVDEQGRSQNGFLRLYDLYNLKLSADLVVLSACQTALGKEIQGEGLVGLTRGFMYAGAPRVIASLWQIDDRASAEFMKRFYQGMLVEKLRPAAALKAAQASMRNDKRWHSPHYWAAFTLQGEWN